MDVSFGVFMGLLTDGVILLCSATTYLFLPKMVLIKKELSEEWNELWSLLEFDFKVFFKHRKPARWHSASLIGKLATPFIKLLNIGLFLLICK